MKHVEEILQRADAAAELEIIVTRHKEKGEDTRSQVQLGNEG